MTLRTSRPIRRLMVVACLVLFGASCSDSNSSTDDTTGAKNQSLSFHEPFRVDPPSVNAIDGDFRLTLTSSGVSSAFVRLNNRSLFGPSDFHNKSFQKTIHVTLETENMIEAELRGSPGDQLCVRIFGVTGAGEEDEFFNRCVDRRAGPPNHVDETFGLSRLNLSAAGTHMLEAIGVSFTDARLVLGDITFQPLEVCQGTASEKTRNDFLGPSVVNLLTNVLTPPLGSAFLSSGAYCRVDLKLEMLGTDEVPMPIPTDDPIVGTALLANGTRLSDGTPWTLTISLDDPFQLENDSGFDVTGNKMDLFLAFDLSHWFDGVDLAAATISNGTIFLDTGNNMPLFESIQANIVSSSQLFADQDQNGSLDSSEIETEDILASGVSPSP